MTTKLIRLLVIFLQQFCFALDCCHMAINGRGTFPFVVELFTLSFERIPTTRSGFPSGSTPRNMTDAHMSMWQQLLPNMGQSEWPCSLVDREVYDLLAGVDHLERIPTTRSPCIIPVHGDGLERM